MNEILKGLKETKKEDRELTSVGFGGVPLLKPSRVDYRATDESRAGSEGQFSPMRLKLKNEFSFTLQAADNRLKAIFDPRGIVGEQYRMLRAKLSKMQKEKGVRTLLVSSTVPNEGKTLVSCGIAAVLAQEPGRRVLLIDADLRKPDVYRNLGLTDEGRFDGFGRLLRGEIELEDALLACSELDLYFLPSGPVPRNPAELLSSRHLEVALNRAAQLFDWIVIDSPPILPLADTSLLAPYCDTALLVVHANSTPAKLIKEAIAAIGRDKFCGVILNRVREIRTSSYYHYYHHQSLKREK
jgi:capsular exopolysaccharide synthesis family protein